LASRRVAPSIANPEPVLATAPEAGEFRTHELTLPEEASGLRFDQALARSLPQYSRAALQAWIASGAVRVAGRELRGKDRVHGGEQVRINVRLAEQTRLAPEALPLAIVYRDRALFIIDKPAGLVVHPGAGNPRHTLQNALLAADPKLALVPRSGLVHRLDKDTSGLLIVARTPEAHTALAAALAQHTITREYLALCTGVLSGGGTIREPIGRHRTQRTRMAVRPGGRAAVTHYRIERRFAAHTLLRVTLETGRTHQIRVHLAHAGFPLVGDALYGGRRRIPRGCPPELRAELAAFPRQALHAARLKFAHPLSGRALEFASPLPADMERLLVALETAER